MTRTSWRSGGSMRPSLGPARCGADRQPPRSSSVTPACLGQLAEAGLGQGHLAVGDGVEVRVVGVLAVLGSRPPAELALVQHDLGDLLVGEGRPGRHGAAAADRLLGGAVGGRRPAVGAEADPGGVVAPVGPKVSMMAPSTNAGACHAGAGARRGRRRSCRRRPRRPARAGRPRRRAAARGCGRRCSPTAAGRPARHGPVRDALPLLGRLDVGGLGLGRLGLGPPRPGGGRGRGAAAAAAAAGSMRRRRRRRRRRRGPAAPQAQGRTALAGALQKVLGDLGQRKPPRRVSGRSLYARSPSHHQAWVDGASGGPDGDEPQCEPLEHARAKPAEVAGPRVGYPSM